MRQQRGEKRIMVFQMRTLAVVTMLFGALLISLAQPALAQDDEPLTGTTVESLGAIEPVIIEGWNLVFLRITMEPGSEIDVHSHPGPVVLEVDSGVFVTEFVHGSGMVTRAAVNGTPAATEMADTGVEITLNPGDSVAYDQTEGHTMVNGADEPLVLLVSALLASDEQGFLFEEGKADGTPVARVNSGAPLMPY